MDEYKVIGRSSPYKGTDPMKGLHPYDLIKL